MILMTAGTYPEEKQAHTCVKANWANTPAPQLPSFLGTLKANCPGSGVAQTRRSLPPTTL